MTEKGFETFGLLACIGYFLTGLIALLLWIQYFKLAKCVKVIAGESNSKAPHA